MSSDKKLQSNSLDRAIVVQTPRNNLSRSLEFIKPHEELKDIEVGEMSMTESLAYAEDDDPRNATKFWQIRKLNSQ